MLVIWITGTLWSGKWSIMDYLIQKYWFTHFSFRKFYVEKIQQKWWEINRDMMKKMADSLREKFGPGYAAEELYEQAKLWWQNAVLESIRAVGEVETLKAKGNFYLFAVDADPSVRYERIRLRNNETDHVSYEKFISDEQREFANEDPTQGNIQKCMQLADFHFDNNGTLEQLQQQVDEVMNKIVKQ